MNIQGISGYGVPTVLPGTTRTPGPQGPDTGSSQGVGTTRVAPDPRTTHAVGRASDTVPMDAPPGTDPMLWSVLTTEERSYFARARAMGQVTYGPGSRSASAGVPRGGRIDVRV